MLRRLRLVDVPTHHPVKGASMRLAFATHDRTRVDAHFASARTFLFYDVGPDTSAFLEVVQFGTVSQEDGNHDEGEDRLASKIDALGGTSLLFVRAIGGPAAARVVRAKVHPVKLSTDEPIAAIIDRVQTMLRTNPPPWLRRALKDPEGGDERFIDDGD